MKRVFFGVTLALVLFVSVVAVVMWNNYRTENTEVSYAGEDLPTLPTVSFTLLDRQVNVLIGYRDEAASVNAVDSLLPVGEDGTISMKISAGDTLVDSAEVSLYSLDGERLLEQTEVPLSGLGDMTAEYKMTSLAETGDSYRLTIKLNLSDGTEGYYSVKVCQYEEETFSDKEELISFAEDFSDGACAKDDDAISDYISYDSELAGTDLHYVNLSTQSSLVEWALLDVTKQEQSIRIYEWYDTQVSIALEYDAELAYGDEVTTARVSEGFCVRERDDTLYLLSYERYASEYFDGDADGVGSTSIILGIQQPDTMDLLYTDYGINVYFTVDGGVWHYNYNSNELVSVFSFGDGSSDIRLNPDRYEVGLCGIYDASLYFTVTGYMESGDHEGEMGFSLYSYDISERECRELMYAPLSLSENEAALVTISDDGLFYVNLGDAIYSLDLSGNDVLKIYEGIDVSTMMVSENGDIVAWQYADDDESIYLLNTKSASLKTTSESSGLSLLGFVGEDLVYARMANTRLTKEGFVFKSFFDRIYIADEELVSKTEYEKDDILVSDVTLTDTGLTFMRYEVDGDTCTQIEDDVLSLAGDDEESMVVELKVATSDAKRNYYYINLGRTISAGEASCESARIIASEPVSVSPTAVENTDIYSAYLFGRLVCSSENLSEAIAAVYDDIGAVYSGSFLSECIWNRDARDLYLTMTLPTMSWTLEGHEEEMSAMNSLERGVDIFVYAGVNAGIVDEEAAESEERKACATVYEELTMLFGDNLIDLTGSDIGYLLYYVNLRHPVLCLTGEDESLIITGYTSTELSIYDPATRETSSVAREDAQEYFDAYNTIFLSF